MHGFSKKKHDGVLDVFTPFWCSLGGLNNGDLSSNQGHSGREDILFKRKTPEVEAITLCQDADILVLLLQLGGKFYGEFVCKGPAFGLNRGLFLGPKKREIGGAEIRTMFVLERYTGKLGNLSI